MGRLQGQPARNVNVKEQEKPSDEGNHRLGPSNRNGTLEVGTRCQSVASSTQA